MKSLLTTLLVLAALSGCLSYDSSDPQTSEITKHLGEALRVTDTAPQCCSLKEMQEVDIIQYCKYQQTIQRMRRFSPCTSRNLQQEWMQLGCRGMNREYTIPVCLEHTRCTLCHPSYGCWPIANWITTQSNATTSEEWEITIYAIQCPYTLNIIRTYTHYLNCPSTNINGMDIAPSIAQRRNHGFYANLPEICWYIEQGAACTYQKLDKPISFNDTECTDTPPVGTPISSGGSLT